MSAAATNARQSTCTRHEQTDLTSMSCHGLLSLYTGFLEILPARKMQYRAGRYEECRLYIYIVYCIAASFVASLKSVME